MKACIHPRIDWTEVTDPAGLGPRWQALEARADGSFFQSWDWVGCQAETRLAGARLLSATQDGRDVALALLGRRGQALHLGASGIAALDSIYVEHNGVLVERGRPDLLGACYAALRPRGRARLVLPGVGQADLDAAGASGGVIARLKTQPAPFVDLTRPFLDSLSPGTRYQLRRSARSYRRHGALQAEPAGTAVQAGRWLDALAVLHQAHWTARGRPGAFARPEFLAFHQALIARAWPRAQLLRVRAGDTVIGYLYDFRFRGSVLSYQSGFAYAEAGPHEKPGMTCHYLAIEQAAAAGFARYDFLAGQDRTKTSLGSGSVPLHWAELVARWSPRGMIGRLRATLAPALSPALSPALALGLATASEIRRRTLGPRAPDPLSSLSHRDPA